MPRRGVIIAGTLAVLLTAVGIVARYPQLRAPASPPDRIVVGGSSDLSAGLVDIAVALGFTAREHLDIGMKRYDAGKFALQDLIDDKVDLAMAADTAFVFRSFDHAELRILAVINQAHTTKLLARKDRGIAVPSDLKGKRIALTRGTSTEFFLEQYASFNGMSIKDMRLIDLKPPEIVTALESGDVDVALTWDPFVLQIRKSLGDEVIVWDPQGSDHQYFLLIAKEGWLSTHGDAVKRLLTSLLQAEDVVKNQPARGMRIVTGRAGYEPENAELAWSYHQYTPRLPQDLLPLLEAQARWMIANRLTPAVSVPNYLGFISTDAMNAVGPQAVSIVH